LSKEYDGFLYGSSPYSNRLFFCGKNGIDYFDPDSVGLSDVNPGVWITDFKLFNESVPIAGGSRDTGGFALTEDISHARHLTLRYDQNVITFDYVALDFSSPRTIQYAYRLIGFDKDWQMVGNKRSATFTNLDPGDYIFQVDIQPGVPVPEIKLPPLIIQPYIENAIWHGLQYKTTGKGKLLLQVVMLEGECRITVEDNGIGRLASYDVFAHRR